MSEQLKDIPSEIWVYGSVYLGNDWKAWECLHETREGLAEKCIKDYGRIPSDVTPMLVPYKQVPEEHRKKFYNEFSDRHDRY